MAETDESVNEDRWGDIIFDCFFGDQRLDVMTTTDSLGRALARHVYPHRDGAALEDMGGEPRKTRCRLIFTGVDDHTGLNHDERFAAFLKVVNLGLSQRFIHPITGSYTARVGDFTVDASATDRDTIVADCTFEEDSLDPAVFEAAPGTPVTSGIDQVTQASADLDDALAAAGVTSPIGPTVTATAQAWDADPTKTVRDVDHELEAALVAIDDAMGELDAVSNLSRWPVLAALTNLAGALRAAAATFSARAPKLIQITVASPAPLLVIAMQLVGAAQASDYADQLLHLNRIPNQARIERGTVLTAPSPSSGSLRTPG